MNFHIHQGTTLVKLRIQMLSNFEDNDFHKLRQHHSDMKMKVKTQGYLYPYVQESVKKWFAKIRVLEKYPKDLYWAIREQEEFQGYCCLNRIDWRNRHAEVGIIVFSTGKGLGAKTLLELETYAFKTLGLRKLYARVLCTNSQGVRLFEKLGFIKEGVLMSDYLEDGIFVDNYIYAKFSED